LPAPFEGDFTASPSGMLTASRIAGGGTATLQQEGYRIRRMASPEGFGINPELKEAATLCVEGGKASFSFDERFLAYHHYVDNDDAADMGLSADEPAYQALISQSANVEMVDLKTGKRYRLTTMKPHQYALYPHFRADGWLVFLVRDREARKETVMVSNAALLLQ
jgi:hypothetical protein